VAEMKLDMSWLQLKEDLPPGVHAYPTLKGKKRYELLQAFNAFLVFYISLHKLIVPLLLVMGQTGGRHSWSAFGVWYFYHVWIAWLMEKRKPRNAFLLVYSAWFAVGMLTWMIVGSFMKDGLFVVGWHTISGLLTYGSSLIFTFFLLYRMRMPTSQLLFKLDQRIAPKWGYALPYFFLGTILGLLFLKMEFHV
jgi:hypothetical protein